MGKEHQKGVRSDRIVKLKCPLCGNVHTATEYHSQSLKRWKTIKKMPANKINCWFECPSCREASKGIDLIPIVEKGGEVTGEGWFAYYHIPLEEGVVSDVESPVPALSGG